MLAVPDAKHTLHLPEPTYTILGYFTCPDFNLILYRVFVNATREFADEAESGRTTAK